MPTRTEVIQALRARDELQNRDIANILDYLEQEAASSSSTRDTILRSRRRIQDEVTERDLAAIYNYLAELGTPASTLATFLQGVRRRDIMSIALANHIMDLIDAASFAPVPPEAANIAFWFSSKELGCLWQDSGRTIPVTTTEDRVGAVDNQGIAAPAFLSQSDNAERPFYRTGLTGAGGQGLLDGDSLGRWLVGTALTAALTGQTVALVWWNRTGGIKQANGDIFTVNDGAGDSTLTRRASSGSVIHDNSGSGGSSTAVMVAETMSALVSSNDGALSTLNFSDDVGAVVNGNASLFPQIGDVISILANDVGGLGFNGAFGDLIIYDKGLGAPSTADLISFIETRWSMTFL